MPRVEDLSGWQASLLVVACAVLCADITTAAEPDRAAVKTVTQTVEALIDDLSTDVNADDDSSAHGQWHLD